MAILKVVLAVALMAGIGVVPKCKGHGGDRCDVSQQEANGGKRDCRD